jgi:hypothetical protein
MEVYDALVPKRTQLYNALEGSSIRVITPLNQQWLLYELELSMYNLAVEKGDSTAAQTHLDALEVLLNSGDLEITYQSYLLRSQRVEKYVNASIDQVFTMPAGSLLVGFDIRGKSGTTTVFVGTSDGGKNIMGDRVVGAGSDSNNNIRKTFASATIIYISISGGTVDLNIDYEENYLT